MKQKEMAKWLKFITVVAGGMGLFFLILILPSLVNDLVETKDPRVVNFLVPTLVFVWITALPCYLSLWRFWGICTRIGEDNSFCLENALALKAISKYMITDCLIYIFATVILAIRGLFHPGILLIILVILFVGFSLAVITIALSHLVLKGSVIKQENDLTI